MRSRAGIQGHPIHPILVAFPIALFITSFVLDVISLSSRPQLAAAAWYCAIVGLIGGVAATIPGAIDLFTVVPPRSSARSLGLLHGALNAIVLVLFIAMVAHRGSSAATPDGESFALSGAGVLLMLFSGWLGGALVYRYHIGVDRSYAGAGKWRERTLDNWNRPVCSQGELAEGQMMLAHISGERVVIARCADGFAAFNDRCPHQGGPLSDGALAACTVQCPWHGSQFNVHTGRVITGPADHKIDTYDVEVRAGEVYVHKPGMPERKAA